MVEERVRRRLAAILAADVVGYSRMMGEDETGTLARLQRIRREFLHPKVAEYGGRIVKTTGDGTLIEFPSAVDAVQHAIDVQTAIGPWHGDTPSHQRIDLRIGINVGDIIIDGDDIYGDGVNVAARLEAISDPGTICISGTAFDQVRGKLDVAFDDLGSREVKNIAEPVRVYRWSAGQSGAVGVTRLGPNPAVPDKPSIAVLPFANLSNDPDQDYFSDGMAEDLITDISKISGLFVVAPNSSFAFKGQSVDVKAIAGKLGVRHVLEGSVRKMGDRLRVNAQLIDAATGGHLWAERYDGDMAHIFEFQDDIRAHIVSALQVSLTPKDQALTARKPTNSVEAYDLFLKGRSNYFSYTPERFVEAIDCLEQAIALDPEFAAAYGYLSYCHFHGWSDMAPGFEDHLDLANELAEKGVALDGNSAIALSRLGWVQTFMRRYDQALANFDKAAALAPDDAEVHATFGEVLNYYGDPHRALAMMDKAFGLETFVPANWEFHIGHSHLLLQQYDEALARFSRATERIPKFLPPYVLQAWTYVGLNRLDDARRMTEVILGLVPRYTLAAVEQFFPYRLDDNRDRLLGSLRAAGLPEG